MLKQTLVWRVEWYRRQIRAVSSERHSCLVGPIGSYDAGCLRRRM